LYAVEDTLLNLAEELFLLAINDDKGTLVGSASITLPYGLAGAILAELVLLGKLAINEKRRLVILDPTPTGVELLDEALAKMEASKPRKADAWIGALSAKRYQKHIVAGLVEKGVLTQEEKRFFWVIPYAVYPQQDASAKYWVKQHLRGVVLAADKPEPRVVFLLSLLKACNLLNLVFTKDERKASRRTIDQLVKSDQLGEAISQAIVETIQAIESSISVAVIAATTG
jgi:hypothetical protein